MKRTMTDAAGNEDALRQILTAHPLTAGDRAYAGIIAVICARLLPRMLLKDMLGCLPAHDYADPGARLLATLRTLGFVARPVRTPIRRLRPSRAPILLIAPPRPDGSPRFWLLVAEAGALVAIAPDGAHHAPKDVPDGELFCLSQEDHVDPLSLESRRHRRHTWLRALLTTFGALFGVVALTTAMVNLLSLAQPFAIVTLYHAVFSRGDMPALPWLAGAMVMVFLANWGMMTLRAHALAWLAARLNYLVGRATFERIMHLPAAVAQRLDAKDQSSRIRSFENISDFITGPLTVTLLDLPAGLVGLVIITVLLWPAGLLLLVATGLFATIFKLANRRMRVLTSMSSDLATQLQRTMVATFEQRETIRLCGLQTRWADLQQGRIARAQHVALLMHRLMARVEAACSFTFAASFIGVTATVALAGQRFALGATETLLVMFLSPMVLAPLHGLCMALPRYEQGLRGLEQINQFMQVGSEIEQDRLRRRLPTLTGRLDWRGVTMRVEDGRALVLGLDIAIAPGESVALSGAAGSGKSLVLALAHGRVAPSFGTMLVEGIDVAQLPLRALRSAIGLVPQHPVLLPGTLADNLAMANPLASEASVARVLASVGLDGLDLGQVVTEAAEDATSPFIWQFALAQALLASSGFLLMDEIPNAVVNGKFGAILKNVLQSAKGRLTVIFVTNRTDLLELADRVIVLRALQTPLILGADQLAEVA